MLNNVSKVVFNNGCYYLLCTDVLYSGNCMAILTDYRYWGQQEIFTKLEEWCEKYNSSIQGMTVVFPDEETAMMFKLSW